MCGTAPIYLSRRSEIPRQVGGATYPGSKDGPSDPLFSLAPDWVYPAPSVTLRAVGSYPTFSPLSRKCGTVYFLWHWPSCRLLNRHAPIFMGNPALWCPDFPLPSPKGRQREPANRLIASRCRPGAGRQAEEFINFTCRNTGFVRRNRSGSALYPFLPGFPPHRILSGDNRRSGFRPARPRMVAVLPGS